MKIIDRLKSYPNKILTQDKSKARFFKPISDVKLTVHYAFNYEDTCSIVFLQNIVNQISAYFTQVFPEFANKVINIDFYNSVNPTCPKENFHFNEKTGNVSFSTDYLASIEKDGLGLGYTIAKAIAYNYMFFLKIHKKSVLKNNYVLRYWKKIRHTASTFDFKSTFVNDFIEMFTDVILKSKPHPDHVLGLKQLYLLWYKVNSLFNQNTKLICYYTFSELINHNVLNFYWFEYDFTFKCFSAYKMDTKGVYLYSLKTDNWIQVEFFEIL